MPDDPFKKPLGDSAIPSTDGPQQAERRASPRYPFVAVAEVTELSSGARLSARTSDLSLGGCYIDTLKSVMRGESFGFRFPLLLFLLALSPLPLAAQAEEKPAASAAKQSSAQGATSNCSNEDPKAAGTSPNIKSPSSRVEGGCVTGNVYRNDFLGFSFEFPEGWVTERPETLHKLNEKWEVAARHGPPELQSFGMVIPLHMYSPKVFFYASGSGKGDGNRLAIPSIRIGAQQTDERFLDIEKLRHKFEHVDQKRSARLLRPADGFVLKGHPFFRLEFEGRQGTTPIWVSRLQTFLNGHMVLFEFYAPSEEELQQLAGTLQSISFTKAKP